MPEEDASEKEKKDKDEGKDDQELHWQKRLENAQNVLFCKELFSQLAKEAIQLRSPIPHMVVGNRITASLFPDIQVVITFVHTADDGKAKTGGGGSSGGTKEKRPPATQGPHSHVLEHSLHQVKALKSCTERATNSGSSTVLGQKKEADSMNGYTANRSGIWEYW